jgi:sugar lactone lactonase YvrE
MKTITKIIYSAFAVAILTLGALTANGAHGDLFVSINGSGQNGAGSINQYKPTGLQKIVASGLSEPRGVAFNSSGKLFVANTTFDPGSQTFQVTIVKITQGGVQTVATLSGNLFGEGVAFDSAGNLFVMAQDHNDPNLASTIYKITPGGVISTFGSTPGQGFGLAFDSAGNLFAADAGLANDTGQTIWKFNPDGTRTLFVGQSAFNDGHGPNGLAFDRFGNLFVSEGPFVGVPGGSDRILKFTPNGMESEFATGLDEPRGLAFDGSGNLFVAASVFEPSGDILKFTPDGMQTLFASGIVPEFLAFQRRATTTQIQYHGGPVMLGTTNVYFIWYGNWANNTATQLLPFFASNIGGSSYFNINTTYYDGNGNHVSNSVDYGGSTADDYSQGSSLSDDAVRTIVTDALTDGSLPLDPNGIYFVLTSADVVETSGFCSQYCYGFHRYMTVSGVDVKYAFIGNPDQCASHCEPQTISPNNNPGADAMASSIARFLDESVTDPLGTAWYDGQGRENATKCDGQYGTTSLAGNGSRYNMVLNGTQFLIQENWVNAGFGYCSMSY